MIRQRNVFLPSRATGLALAPLALSLLAGGSGAQIEARDQTKLSATEGSITGPLEAFDRFGCAVAALGDLDGNGVADLAVGACGDDDGDVFSPFSGRGAVHILRLDAAGAVLLEGKISATAGGFGGALDAGDRFGGALAALGDLDGNGAIDLAVGAPGDDDGGLDAGAVWILFLDTNGAVLSEVKLAGLSTLPVAGDGFGSSLGLLGDLDGDGSPSLAVGGPGVDGSGTDRGAVWVLELSSAGAVTSEVRLDDGVPSLGLLDGDAFGASVSLLGDLDGDGADDIAVGATGSDDGGPDRGAVHLVRIDANVAVLGAGRISATAGSFPTSLNDGDELGGAVATAGDLDGDGTPDLLVSAGLDDSGGTDRGATFLLLLDAAGSVINGGKLGSELGGFGGELEDGDVFGQSVCSLGDVDGDGVAELAIGAGFDDDGATGAGGVWLVYYDTLSRALITSFNGDGTNPELLSITGSPILGAPFVASVDLAALNGDASFLQVNFGDLFSGPVFNGPVLQGQLLVSGPGLPTFFQIGGGTFNLSVPDSAAVIGARIQLQGVVFKVGTPMVEPTRADFTNAFELTFGTF